MVKDPRYWKNYVSETDPEEIEKNLKRLAFFSDLRFRGLLAWIIHKKSGVLLLRNFYLLPACELKVSQE